jgi:hypothetical protein
VSSEPPKPLPATSTMLSCLRIRLYIWRMGKWSAKYGYPPMPFDGCLFGSRMMIAKEAHTSYNAKTWRTTYPRGKGKCPPNHRSHCRQQAQCYLACEYGIAKEAHTSYNAKKAIADAPGVDDAEWEKTYQKATGGARGISNCLLGVVRGVCLLCNHHARAEETAVEGHRSV